MFNYILWLSILADLIFSLSLLQLSWTFSGSSFYTFHFPVHRVNGLHTTLACYGCFLLWIFPGIKLCNVPWHWVAPVSCYSLFHQLMRWCLGTQRETLGDEVIALWQRAVHGEGLAWATRPSYMLLHVSTLCVSLMDGDRRWGSSWWATYREHIAEALGYYPA